jgi:hypothetical protein
MPNSVISHQTPQLGLAFVKLGLQSIIKVMFFLCFFGLCGSQAEAQNTESLSRLYSICRLL